MTEIDPEKFDGITDIADLPRCYIARAVFEDAVAKGAQELKETIDQEILDDLMRGETYD